MAKTFKDTIPVFILRDRGKPPPPNKKSQVWQSKFESAISGIQTESVPVALAWTVMII
jgi:hypothetical protein